MKNKGLRQYRFGKNPLEKAFAKKWDEINSSECNILGFLLSKNSGKEIDISDKEREQVATVIQWLGSPVGQMFIENVMKKEGS